MHMHCGILLALANARGGCGGANGIGARASARRGNAASGNVLRARERYRLRHQA